MTTHLVIPDPHATPEVSNERFDWLGQLIVDKRPDVIVCLGDFADFPSLSSYDKGKKSFEGRRLQNDINVALDAQRRMFVPLAELQARQRNSKHKIYNPMTILIGGNHDEGRINKAIDLQPELEGLLSLDDLEYESYWNLYVPYQDGIEADGIWYTHHCPAGNTSLPIGGLYMGRKLLQKNHRSTIVGHAHVLDIATDVSVDGNRMWGISAGCFFDHTPSYANASARFWWRGVLWLDDVKDGDFSLSLLTIDHLRTKYA